MVSVMDELLDDSQKYKCLLENNPDGVCELDLLGRFVEVNRTYEQLTGYLKNELLGMNFKVLMFPEDIQAASERFETGIRGVRLNNAEAKIKHKDGRCIYIRYTRVPIIVQDKIIGLYTIAKDVTEQKQVEELLKQKESMLVHSQRIAHVGSWEFDPVHQVSFWSAELFNIYGIQNTGYISLKEATEYIHPEDRDRFIKSAKALSEGHPYDVQFRIIRRNGEIRVLHSKREMCISHGEIRLIGTVQDITDQTRTHEALLRSEKLSVVGQLAAGVAHEIRNPLTALKGFLKLIPKTDDPRPYLAIMESELSRIESVTSELLMLAKPQVRQLKPIDIRQSIDNVLDLLSTHALMKSIDICVDVVGNDFCLECDPCQVEQVWINLIKNAIEAAPVRGKIVVQLNHDDNMVFLGVTDNGPGIPQEIIDKLGEPFFTTKESGTGLGLMICHKIIAEHHGKLEVMSKVGEGTTVRVALPSSREHSDTSGRQV
ncbi:PAS domain S-box protein [Alicyclobacillus tolerans]|uniref:PAS domain S-box protein n=1 Tax=Alicyclobacillus tolerans TaxID=90970 RepID=UPI001F214042|nr:PAS domain S-box protein [Alicyclobacillus tolerans]MCF8565448.1 PAS domain S-box protein [Alicyclobacillus tolerans]